MKIYLKLLFFLTMSFLFFSCTTMNESFYEKAGEVVADQINNGMDDTLIDESLYPFAFETEILVTENQIHLLWNGLIEAGYLLTSPQITMVRPALLDDYILFSESWEMRTFFEKYIHKDDRFVQIDGEKSSLILLLRKEDKDFSILGMKEAEK